MLANTNVKMATVSFIVAFLNLAVLGGQFLYGQNSSAIYLVSRLEGKLCPKKLQLMNSSKYFCLEKRPLLTSQDFAAVTDIFYTSDQSKRQFDIMLNERGRKMLNSLTLVTKGSQIAVVVNSNLVSIIDVRPPFNSRLISLWDNTENQDFVRIHRELKQDFKDNTQSNKL